MTDTTPAPPASLVDEAAEILGCESWFRGQTRIVCETHGDVDWPCPVAVDLAAKIAARDALRDAQTRADECEAIAAMTATIRTESMSHPSERGDEDWAEGMHDTLEAFTDRMRERAAAHRERVQG